MAISSDSQVSTWARCHSVRIEKSLQVVPAEELACDYLFSIAYLKKLDDNVLNSATRGAINFHDGPLPGYAGLNVPVWALINGEVNFGITWHYMSSQLDQGAIIESEPVPLSGDDTALTLNTKCFSAGLRAFDRLLPLLTEKPPAARPQTDSSGRTYHRADKPNQFGMLNGLSTDEQERLVRALDFGEYANPMTTAKIIAGRPMVVRKLDTTQTGIARYTELESLTGQSIATNELPNDTSPLTSEQLEKATQTLTHLSKFEDHWREQLRTFEPLGLYNTDLATNEFDEVSFEHKSPDTALALFVCLLARISDRFAFGLCATSNELSSIARDSLGLASHLVPHKIKIDPAQSLTTTVNEIRSSIESISEKQTFPTDLIGRTPQLRSNPAFENGLPAEILIADSVNAQAAQDTAIVVRTTATGLDFRFRNGVVTIESRREYLERLVLLSEQFDDDPSSSLNEVLLLSEAEQVQIARVNATQLAITPAGNIHEQFERQAAQTPEAVALVAKSKQLTYAQLNSCANQVAEKLIKTGVGSNSLIGVYTSRSIEMLVSTLAIMKIGCAYVPLDPAFPTKRIEYIVDRSNLALVLFDKASQSALPQTQCVCMEVDEIFDANATTPNQSVNIADDALAYVIFTSGSTGNPKGVMVEHRNVANFFCGMDDIVSYELPATWLAVTSLSFDICVLELFWTLCRGFKVVLHNGDTGPAKRAPSMQYGLFMWGNDDGPGSDKYRLMIEGSKFLDQHGFESVWTPERHFHAFGGPYPNPAVTSAAIAAVTENIAIRSGSIVSPLHHSVRIAEDWAVVDNLSNGRVGLSFAAGWQPNDFVLAPENFADNKQIMFDQIRDVQKLWKGESVAFKNPMGDLVEVTTLPRPVQPNLPIWVTAAGNPDTFFEAGRSGANVLTHLLGQNLVELSSKIKRYNEGREKGGHDVASGHVSLMLHTFVGDDLESVRNIVREPLKDYLRSSMKLVIDFAWTFPAFKRPHGMDVEQDEVDLKKLSKDDSEAILDFAFERYFETSGLFGPVDRCVDYIASCEAIGVDEVACLLDFGVPTNDIFESLPKLVEVRERSNKSELSTQSEQQASFAELATQHSVSHFQCTPSMAKMIVADPANNPSLAKMEQILIGGEAFPEPLANDLQQITNASIHNMYGPTETTIWSTSSRVETDSVMSIGTPIANTTIYILDQNNQPLPPGVIGRLHIGGLGVTPGYFGQEDLTKERFKSCTVLDETTRLYDTGDLAKLEPNGTLTYCGRIDNQVKVRGYRIELGEIESAILKSDNIDNCAVILREEIANDQRISAYLVVKPLVEIDLETLRADLNALLPGYMIPNEFIPIDEIPLTPNGKLDRNSLPAPSNVTVQASAEYVAPQDDLQNGIVGIWQEILNTDRVGIDDNFFDLGGHSLLIVQTQQKLNLLMQDEVSLTDLYRFPTIRSLTNHLTGADSEDLNKSVDRAARRRDRLGLRNSRRRNRSSS